jgi:hypothetical protein
LRVKRAISVPNDVREIVEFATRVDHLEGRAFAFLQRWVELWKRLYGRAMAASQQALSGLVDRSQGYDQALINERVPTRLGDGSVDVEVKGKLISPLTGEQIDALSIRANWLREAEPGSPAVVVGQDASGRTLVEVGSARLGAPSREKLTVRGGPN